MSTTRCDCGKGDEVLLPDGTLCCTASLARFEALYGHAYGEKPKRSPGLFLDDLRIVGDGAGYPPIQQRRIS